MIYELGHIFKSMLLPPVSLGWLLLFSVWQFRRRPRLSRALIAMVVLGGYGLATPFVSELLLREVSVSGDSAAYSNAQAIVILGAESSLVWDRQRENVVEANPGRFTLLRTLFGARLAKKTKLPILVSGGHVAKDGPALAEVMRDVLQRDFGVDVRWTEDQSRSTAENADFSARILLPEEIRRVILVTSGFHLRRAISLFEHAGFTVIPAPVPPTTPAATIEWKDFLPDPHSLVTSYYAFHEFGGLVYGMFR